MISYKGGILGVGNVLQEDDAIGVRVLKYIEANYIFPEDVELIDGGTVGAGLDTAIFGKEWLVVIDALAVPGEPGDVKLLKGEEFIDKPTSIRMTPHQVGFLDEIQLLRLSNEGPKHVDLIGIVPKSLDFKPMMTPELEASIEKVVETLFEWLKQKDVVPVKRDTPLEQDCWWLPKE